MASSTVGRFIHRRLSHGLTPLLTRDGDSICKVLRLSATGVKLCGESAEASFSARGIHDRRTLECSCSPAYTEHICKEYDEYYLELSLIIMLLPLVVKMSCAGSTNPMYIPTGDEH